MLLSLPPELIQLILRSCDPSSFLQAAFSCIKLLELAISSRELVLFQLHQTPGRLEDWDSLEHRQLFRLLLQRAQKQLFGVETQFESKIFRFKGKAIATRATSLRDSGTQKEILLVFKNDPTVYLMEIQGGQLSLQRQFQIPAPKFGKVQILHTAFSSTSIYVLHRLQHLPDQELDMNHPFVRQALTSNPFGSIFLACYSLRPETGVVKIYGFPEQSDYEPICLAAQYDMFAISWQHPQDSFDHQVVLYTMDDEDEEDEMDLDFVPSDSEVDARNGQVSGIQPLRNSPLTITSRYTSYLLSSSVEDNPGDSPGQRKGPTVRLAFNDRGQQLLHYYRAQTLYNSFQRIHWLPAPGHLRPNVVDNGCVVEFTRSLSLRFSIGIPFFGTHQAGDGTIGSRCHWQYLAVGIATHRVEHWSVACILRSESFPGSHHCGHIMNLERGRRFQDWHIMAQLGGFQEASTSQGSLIAASHQGTRLAMASWKTISIWALEPNALIQMDHGDEFYPESWRSAEEHLEIPPVIIQLDAVCSQLQFTENENELFALTDRGIMLLRLKPDGQGIRVAEIEGNHILAGSPDGL
ncbi:uncharacterized protein N7483_005561 [Penicillium malachiteum]|uniref:uncharacterized protein n=1 Tax=Penicillium malachiteum TaxID=1324776 RepID=UPI002547F878|nr:uncharacterized protein N7483_005561 [Penicillium malachiteum]KAJ5731053.1 hypothetical protein N7483_005561 [Penicillium malachiteum]